MTLGRQGLLALLALVFLVGLALTISRLVAARRSGLSFRLQVFLPLAATTLTLSAAFAVIVIDRFTARASVFAQRGAQDEARVLAELASRALDAPGATLDGAAQQLSRVLPAFTHSEIATHVEIVDAQGRTVVAVGEAQDRPGVQIVVASAPIRDQGFVRVRKATFGMVALMSDVAPKVALLAFILALASAVVAILIGQAVAGPIERLTRAAQRVAAGERQAALPQPRGREVRELTEALESMRRELEQRHALENFVADLSHELKNPIASVRASAEVLTEGAADEPETHRARGHRRASAPGGAARRPRRAARPRQRSGPRRPGVAAARAGEPARERRAALARRRAGADRSVARRGRLGGQRGGRGPWSRSGRPRAPLRALRHHAPRRGRHRPRPRHRARRCRAARRPGHPPPERPARYGVQLEPTQGLIFR